MEQQPTDVASKIFESHFQQILEPDMYARAKSIFDQAGAYNERSLAIQIYTAYQFDKLDDVLESYEQLLSSQEYQDLDFVTRATYVRVYADHVYGEIITEGDPMRILEMRAQMEIPKIFDSML
ncbi:MAG: hypothetical protein ACREBJ_07970 [Nitrosotalea sp.]